MNTIFERLREIFSGDRVANWVAHVAPRLVIALVIFAVF